MIIITQPNATEEQIERVVARVREYGLEAQISRGASRVIIGVIGAEARALQVVPVRFEFMTAPVHAVAQLPESRVFPRRVRGPGD